MFQELAKLPVGTTIIHGAARGADRMAGEIATELGLRVVACPADWARYGKAAGLIRNRQMLDEYKPQLVLAFVQDWANSRGTQHTVSLSQKRGIWTQVFCLGHNTNE